LPLTAVQTSVIEHAIAVVDDCCNDELDECDVEEEEITRAKQQPGFNQEFGLQWGSHGLNPVFNLDVIEAAVKRGQEYNPDQIIPYSPKVLCIDPGFSASSFAFVIGALQNGRLEICYAAEHSKPQFQEMVY
jgi:hypothetical protein